MNDLSTVPTAELLKLSEPGAPRPKFLVGQRVFFGNESGTVREQFGGRRYVVRETFSWKLWLVHEDELLLDSSQARVPRAPSWTDMTPLERATRWVGRCCDCGAVLPLEIRATAIRCDEHQEVYQRAKQFDLAVGL